jgi:hypothetical protein
MEGVQTLSLMDKNNKRLFIHRQMEPVTLEHSIEIILTPQFYTFIREDLDVNFTYQAKQIAASLFDDYLDTSKEYQYHVYKCENEWCFFAYNIEEIDQFLESKGIEKHRVSKIYFAQQLNQELEQPIKLTETSVLQTIDGTVTVVPARLMSPETEYVTLDLSSLKLNSGVTMGASLNSYISLKETVILASLFTILGTTFLIEGSRIRSSIAQEKNELISLYNENPKYTSTTIRKNILNGYSSINKKERAKRQNIKEISKFLSAKSQLKNLNIEKDKIMATIKTSNKSISNQVKNHAKAKKFKTHLNGLEVKVEKQL